MTRYQTLNILRILADKNGCEYIDPDEDVLNMLVQLAELVEDGCNDKWFDFMVRMVDNINIK